MRIQRKRALLILLALLVAAQAIRTDRRNPPLVPEHTIFTAEAMPANLQSIFRRSCINCHSDETVWPWYSEVAPVSWLIAQDVHHGRSKLNLSEWDGYSAKTKDQKLSEICEQVRSGEMPDSLYAFVHRSARLTKMERTAICTWTDGARNLLLQTTGGSTNSRP